jgi:hypothetical protein
MFNMDMDMDMDMVLLTILYIISGGLHRGSINACDINIGGFQR